MAKAKKTGMPGLSFKLVVFLLLMGVSWILWNKYKHLLNSQAVLDNKKYKAELLTIKNIKQSLSTKKASKAELEKTFLHLICHKIIPYWYGTDWDYNGTTEVPNEGSIACGYFVTTVLKHVGVRIDRKKMAQCASEKMIRSLVSKSNVFYLSHMSILDFQDHLKKHSKGLYVIGLDNHTGFILYTKEGCYFIHASGTYPFQVVKEKVIDSSVLSHSKYRVLGNLSADEDFLKTWLQYQQ